MSTLRDDLLELRRIIDGMLERAGDSRGRANSAVDAQRFTYGDPAHKMKAEAIFDDLQIKDGRRSWFYNKTLEGVPLGELRALIVAEDAKYRARWGGGGRRA